MAEPFLFDEFNGLADTPFSGIKGSFPRITGIDIHSKPGSIIVNQKLTKNSGATIDEFVKFSVSVSDGSRIHFSADSGKIWREVSGTYTLKHTTTPAAGEAKCLGAAEYDGFVFWATESRLHRIAVSNVNGDWSVSAIEDFGTFGNTDVDFHPMVPNLNGKLYIGDGSRVASVNSSASFTANDLDIEPPLRIKTMIEFDIDLVMGTFIAVTVNSCQIVRWDTVETSFQYSPKIQENGINAFIQTDTLLLAQAGRSGRFYFYNGVTLEPYDQRIPGTWSDTQTGLIHPGSVGKFKGVPIFGFSNVAGNPADQGVYSMGSYSTKYQIVISGPEYVISQDKVTSIEIGSILVEDNDVYVAWKDGSNFGVDKLDWSNKFASAFLEFPIIVADPLELSTLAQFIANYVDLPAGTSLTWKYKLNHASSYTTFALSAQDDTDKFQYRVEETLLHRTLQIRVDFNVSVNAAPEIDSFVFTGPTEEPA